MVIKVHEVAEPCAAANCSARHAGCCTPPRRLRPSCPRHLSAASAPRSAVAELGVVSRCYVSRVKRAFCGLCALLAASSSACALSYSTAEGTFAHHLAGYASIYAIQHGGRAPSSWADIETSLDQPIDGAYRHIAPTKRYAFLSQPIRLPPPHAGDLFIITRRPFRDSRLYQGFFGISRGLREPGRYIIYRTPNSEFRASYVDEAYVQQAFRGFESLLPVPDSEPLRRHEVEARWRSILTWSIAAIAAAFIARRVFRRSSTPSHNARNG